jgi:hypothetical protein
MAQHHLTPKEGSGEALPPDDHPQLRQLRHRVQAASSELGRILARADVQLPDATAAAIAAMGYEVLAAAASFLASACDLDADSDIRADTLGAR